MIVYKIEFPNNKVYIGITCRSLKNRMCEHMSRLKTGRKNKLYSAMKKYEGFQVNILKKCETYGIAKEMEKIYIKKYNSNGPGGYNMTDGGDGALGYRPSEETKKNISRAHLGIKLSDAHKKSLSKAKRGFKFSEESKLKMSIWQKNKKKPKKTIDKLKKTLANPFVAVKNDNIVGQWDNICDAVKDLGISRTSIGNCLSGRSKTAGGLKFERVVS